MRIIGSSEGDPDSVVTLSSMDSVVSSTSAQYYFILITGWKIKE